MSDSSDGSLFNHHCQTMMKSCEDLNYYLIEVHHVPLVFSELVGLVHECVEENKTSFMQFLIACHISPKGNRNIEA